MRTSGLYLRTVVFGMLDSLVSTVGFLAGLKVSGVEHTSIALIGIIYASVEGFSMGVGNFLSEESVEEFVARRTVSGRNAFGGAVMMFVVSILTACIPIAPYILFSGWEALQYSVIFSLAALFVVGLVSGRMSRLPMLMRGVRMVLFGGAAIAVGMMVGTILPVG